MVTLTTAPPSGSPSCLVNGSYKFWTQIRFDAKHGFVFTTESETTCVLRANRVVLPCLQTRNWLTVRNETQSAVVKSECFFRPTVAVDLSARNSYCFWNVSFSTLSSCFQRKPVAPRAPPSKTSPKGSLEGPSRAAWGSNKQILLGDHIVCWNQRISLRL